MKLKRFFPVIHLKDEPQALYNVNLAVNAQVDGVFLIHHRAGYGRLINIANEVRQVFPNLWIGINALDKSPIELFDIVPDWIKAIWSDDGGVYEDNGFIQAYSAYNIYKNKGNFKGEFFGGFAFKYQTPVTKLEEGATCADMYSDVVVTSGEGTGIAADIEKIRRIRKGVSGRLGIASGITPENFEDYEPYVDDYLVATGISKDEYNFDWPRLVALKNKIHGTSI